MIIDELHWGPASGWWSGRRDRGIELDVVSASPDRKGELLIGEAKLHISHDDIEPLISQLRKKVASTPLFSSVDNIRYQLFVHDDDISHPEVISGKHIITT